MNPVLLELTMAMAEEMHRRERVLREERDLWRGRAERLGETVDVLETFRLAAERATVALHALAVDSPTEA